jgi:hypothetical protein
MGSQIKGAIGEDSARQQRTQIRELFLEKLNSMEIDIFG